MSWGRLLDLKVTEVAMKWSEATERELMNLLKVGFLWWSVALGVGHLCWMATRVGDMGTLSLGGITGLVKRGWALGLCN
jgi:hypothetical protein